MNFETLFGMGLDRSLPQLLDPPKGHSLGLGESGWKKTSDFTLGLPEWQFPRDPLPFANETIAIVHAYHFMEHLSGENAILLLEEVQRVLIPGGIFQFCIPWAKAEIAFQDLTHKSFWTESSFRMLMNNDYYDPTAGGIKWQLRQHYLVLAGVVERNICLLGQLVKEPAPKQTMQATPAQDTAEMCRRKP
jgi:SAM-dependent methyltransferase